MFMPNFFVMTMSDSIASSDAGVYSPSGHQPWSKGPYWKDDLVVEHEAIDAVFVLGDIDLPHAEVARDRVDRLAVLYETDFQIVEVRGIGATRVSHP